MSDFLKAGWGEADITPDGRVIELAGQYYQRVAKGVHSRLKATALVLESGTDASAMVAIDNLGVPKSFYERLKAAACKAVPELRPDHILVNATHTHTAPALAPGINWWKAAPGAMSPDEYSSMVVEMVSDALKRAWDSRKGASVACALKYASVGHCRRVVYAGGSSEMYGDTGRKDFIGLECGEDSGVGMLFFADSGGKPSWVIVNVACPSQVMESTYMVSSDFMGALRESLKAEFGNDFKTLPQISSAGCQAPRDLSRNYNESPDFWHEDGVEAIAGLLSASVKNAWAEASKRLQANPELRHSMTEPRLPLRRVSYPQYISAKQDVARLEAMQSSPEAYKDFCDKVLANEAIAGRHGPYDDKGMHFVLIRNAEASVKRYEMQDASPELPVEIHAIRIGDAVFVSNPFELFLEFGQRMKARSKSKHTFIVQLANGYDGYLPSPYAERLGGYGAMVINGKIGSDGGAKLVEETLDEIEGLFA